MRLGAFSACVLLSFGLMPSLAQTGVDENVIYGMYSGLALLMDVHHPETPNGYGVLVIGGSGWHTTMDYDALSLKDSMANQPPESAALLDAGYTIFVINHRAAGRFRYPAALDDAMRAVRFIRYRSGQYRIDPDRLGALGDSSGGHLANLLGVMDGKGDSAAASPVDRLDAKVQAIVSFFAPADLVAFARGSEGDKATVGSFIGTRLYPGDDSQELRLYQDASPTFHVTRDDPPVLLIHGHGDSVVPFNQSELFREKLEEYGIPVELIGVEGGHADAEFYENSAELGVPEKVVGWFDRYLRDLQ